MYYSPTPTLQKKEVCTQLFNLEKCFKICYVYVKRKPKYIGNSSFRATLSFTLMNDALVYDGIDFFLESALVLLYHIKVLYFNIVELCYVVSNIFQFENQIKESWRHGRIQFAPSFLHAFPPQGLYFVTSANFVKSSHGKKCYVICVCILYNYIHIQQQIYLFPNSLFCWRSQSFSQDLGRYRVFQMDSYKSN